MIHLYSEVESISNLLEYPESSSQKFSAKAVDIALHA